MNVISKIHDKERNSNTTENQHDALFTDDDELLFSDTDDFFDEDTADTKDLASDRWKILIVDDEKDIHTITRLSLQDFSFNGKQLEFVSAYSAEEAKKLLATGSNYAIIFLDVVMETTHAGLDLVKFIREELKNNLIHIVLRTGQPGYAPEAEVISNFKINDYQSKTDLTESKLFTVTTASLRSFDALKTVTEYRELLEDKVKERTKELHVKNKELEEVNTYKDQMFSIIAHDLKNPVSTVHSLVTLMLEEKLEPNMFKQILKATKKSTRATYVLLENLLSWALCEQGKIEAYPEKFSTKEIIENNTELLSETAHAKSIEIIVDAPENFTVYADKNMITTVLRNLLSNAIKFSHEEDNIIIKATATNNLVEIRVKDSGIGISEEAQKVLFLRNKHHTTYGTKNEKGSGIGLQICRDFVRLNNGDLWVKSKLDEGSEFIFTIPLAK